MELKSKSYENIKDELTFFHFIAIMAKFKWNKPIGDEIKGRTIRIYLYKGVYLISN